MFHVDQLIQKNTKIYVHSKIPKGEGGGGREERDEGSARDVESGVPSGPGTKANQDRRINVQINSTLTIKAMP
jgi:hypothetical protein